MLALTMLKVCRVDTLSMATGNGMRLVVWILQGERGSAWGRW